MNTVLSRFLGRLLVLGLGTNLWTTTATAFETDQLTWRDRVPLDCTVPINTYVAASLEVARVRTEKKARKGWSDARLADEFRKQTVKEEPFNFHYFGARIEAWMKTTLVDEGYGLMPELNGKPFNIYDRYRTLIATQIFPKTPLFFGAATVLTGTQAAPTFISNNVRFGADKLSHFFRLGYRYWQRSDAGRDEMTPVRYGTKSELGFLGYATMSVFSYADLAANFAGYEFYRDLVGKHYLILREPGEKPRLELKHKFDLSEYATEDWDEFLNPSSYAPKLANAVELHLKKHRAQVCAEYHLWAEFSGSPRSLLRPKEQYVDVSIAPQQGDPFRLDSLCR